MNSPDAVERHPELVTFPVQTSDVVIPKVNCPPRSKNRPTCFLDMRILYDEIYADTSPEEAEHTTVVEVEGGKDTSVKMPDSLVEAGYKIVNATARVIFPETKEQRIVAEFGDLSLSDRLTMRKVTDREIRLRVE